MKNLSGGFIKYAAILTISLFIVACSKGDAETSAPAYKQQTATPVSSIQEQNINEPAAEPSVHYDSEDSHIYTDNKSSETADNTEEENADIIFGKETFEEELTAENTTENEYTEAEEVEAENIRIEEQDAKNKELCDAIKNNDLEKVKQALANGARWYWYCSFIGKEDDDYGDQECMLENAMNRGQYEIAEVLLQHGAYLRDVCYADDESGYGRPVYNGYDRIIEEANKGDFQPLDLLLKYQKYPDYYSLCSANKNVQRYILDKDTNKIKYYAYCLRSEDFIDDKDFFELLLSRGITPTLCDVKDVETAKYLLSKGADVNYSRCVSGYCESGHCYIVSVLESNLYSNMDVVNFLIANGAEESFTNTNPWDIMEHSNADIAEYLFSKGINFDPVFEKALKNPSQYSKEMMDFVHKHKTIEILPLETANN
ncbi:MAG: hypothetical protein LBL61_00820 [Elusimicrobiota bacterium]|jgi:ankyrin repeat protein/PBP1b-binding outer membrane lipoprotein LpoB|nr:hypothetical protein [Elusimicrobiota bacterium]